MNIAKALRIAASIPKTILISEYYLFNLHVKCHFFIAYDMKLGTLSGKIRIDAPRIKCFMVRIGLGGSENISSQTGNFSCSKNAEIVFADNVAIGAGNSIMVTGGRAYFGSGFTSNKNCALACSAGLRFGDDLC